MSFSSQLQVGQPPLCTSLANDTGLWGLAGYPLKGIHKSLRNSLSRSKIRDILASRIKQGIGEMVAATPEERAAVIRQWNEMQKGLETNGT